MDGEVMELGVRSGFDEELGGAVGAGPHVPVRDVHAHRREAWREGAGEEADRIPD